MVNIKRAAESISRLAALKFFPSDANAQAGIVQIVCEMAHSNDQIDWLVNRMLVLYNDWPGPREMRACFCSKHKPKDGVECHSQVYYDGIPSEREEINELILGPNHAAGLIEGKREKRDPMRVGVDPAIALLADVKDMNRKTKRGEAITPERRAELQSMIERAVQENRNKRAAQELFGIE